MCFWAWSKATSSPDLPRFTDSSFKALGEQHIICRRPTPDLSCFRIPARLAHGRHEYDWAVKHKGGNGHARSEYSMHVKSDVFVNNAFGTNGEQRTLISSFILCIYAEVRMASSTCSKGTTRTFEVHLCIIRATMWLWAMQWLPGRQDETQNIHTLGVAGVLFEEVGDAQEYNADADGVLQQFATDAANGRCFGLVGCSRSWRMRKRHVSRRMRRIARQVYPERTIAGLALPKLFGKYYAVSGHCLERRLVFVVAFWRF